MSNRPHETAMTYSMGNPASEGSPAPPAAAASSNWKTKGLILLNRLLRTKDPTNLNSPDDACGSKTTLTRCLDTLDLTSLGVGSCVGTGMYLVAGMVARKIAGPGVILSFIIAAVASIFSGACYAEFGVRVPHTTGSAYMYSYVTVGEFVAFVIGWNMVLEYLIGTSACACALSACFNILTDGAVEMATTELFGRGPFGTPPDILAFFITILMTGLLITGAKKSLLFTNVMNVINFGVWAFIVGASLFYLDTSNWTRHGGFLPYGWSGVLTGAATCFYAFIGFDIIATTGEEAMNPKKSIPKAIVGSLFIALIAYVSSSLILTLMLPYNEIDENSGLLEAFGHVGASRCRSIVGIGALAGLTVAMFGSMFPMPRVVYAMAKDGLIFRTLASVWDRTNTPALATVIFGMAAAVAALFISLDVLVEMMSIGTLLAYTLVSTCVLILRYQPKSTTLVELIPESIRTPAMLTPAATPRGSTGDIRQLQNQQNNISNMSHGGTLSPSDCYATATANDTSNVNEVVPGLSRLTSALQNASFPSMKLNIPTNPFLSSNFQQQTPQATTLEVGLSGNVVVTKKVTKGSMFSQCSFDSDTTIGTTEDREEPMTDTDTSADSSWPNKTTVRTTSTNPFLSGAASTTRHQRLTSPMASNRSANMSESNSYDQIDQAGTKLNAKKPGLSPGIESKRPEPQQQDSSKRDCWYPAAFEYIFPQIFPWHIDGPATEETGQMVMRGVGFFLVSIILANVTLVTGIERIEQGSALVTLLMLIFFGASFVSVLFIARHPENRRALPFLTPGLPYIPAVAITVNIYLIFKLSILTLVRFVVWMTIGLLIYFLYGIKNSSAEKEWASEQIELKIKDIVRDGDVTPASSIATEEKIVSYSLRPNPK